MSEDTTTNLADFAASAYRDIAPNGYDIDTELSGPDRRVYVNSQKKAIIAFRGTNPSNKRDVWADLAMAAHLESKTNRFKNSLDVSRRAVDKYGAENIQVTGHSLGGSQAIYVANKLNLAGEAYNPFISSSIRNKSDKFKVHVTVGDPVSYPGTYLVPQKNVNVHAPGKSFWKGVGKAAKNAVINTVLVGQPELAPILKNPYVSKYGKGTTAMSLTKSLHDIDQFTSKGTQYHGISLKPIDGSSQIITPQPRRINYAEAPTRKRIGGSSKRVSSTGRKGR